MEQNLTEIATAHQARIASLPGEEVAFYEAFRSDLAKRVDAANADAPPLMVQCTALLATDIVRFNAQIVDAGQCTLKDIWLFAGMVETLVRSLHTIGSNVVAESQAEVVVRLALKRTEGMMARMRTEGSA